MPLIDWVIEKISLAIVNIKNNREKSVKQKQLEQQAYETAYSNARLKVVQSEAKLDAQYGGKFKRLLKTKMQDIKKNQRNNKNAIRFG